MKSKKLLACIFLLFVLSAAMYCNDTKELLQQGMHQYKIGNYKAAINCFTNVLNSEPNNAEAKKYLDKSAEQLLVPEQKAIEKERVQFMKEAQAALKEHRKQMAELEKQIKPQLREAKKFYNKKYFLSASEIYRKIMLDYPEYLPAKEQYENITADMAQVSNEVQTTDLEKLSYAKGYVAYFGQQLSDALNEWGKVLQINPDREEVNEYVVKVSSYLKDSERLAREKETEERVQRLFAEGTADFNKKDWVLCIKKMESVQAICKNEHLSKSLEWQSKSGEYINRAVEELSKVAGNKRELRPYSETGQADSGIDAAGADKKYSDGLVLYAQGKLFDAVKQWEIAVRLDPNNEKAQRALEKAKKELELQKK